MSELLDIEHQWARAFQEMDKGALEEILAPEFRLSFVTDPRAPQTIDRSAWFEMLDRMSFGAYAILDSKEVEFGEVAAIHARVSFADWKLDGRLLPSEFQVSDVFVRRDGRWRCINRISQPVSLAPDFGGPTS